MRLKQKIITDLFHLIKSGENIKALLLNIIIFLFTHSLAQTHNGGKALSLLFNKEPLKNVLQEIQTIGDINLIFSDDLISDIEITCDIKNMTAENSLQKILEDLNISFKKFDNNSIVLFKEDKKEKNPTKPVVVKEGKQETPITAAFKQPKLISKSNPTYPPQAARSNIKGDVTIRLFVSERGEVTETEITRSSSHSILDSATIDYAKKMIFEPALENGNPVGVWTEMTFHYYFIVNSDSL